MFIAIIIVAALLLLLNLKDKVADWGGDQTRRDAQTGRRVRNLVILAVGGIVIAALANNAGSSRDITLKGSVGYTLNWPYVELRAAKVDYSGDGQTESLRIALYAAPEPFHDGSTSSWQQVGSYIFPTPLKKGQFWSDQQQSVFANRPGLNPACMIFTVEEWNPAGNEWQLRDYRNFDNTQSF